MEMSTLSQVFDAPCTVKEPSSRQQRYKLAFLVTTSTARLWMVRQQLAAWLYAYPHLVVSEWASEADSSVGMRWGVSTAHKSLAGTMCFGRAFKGRFDWLLVADDDTVPDQEALHRLIDRTLSTWATPQSQPWLFAFVPQPWPRKAKNSASWIGCIGNVTTPCSHPPCRPPKDISKPCLGPKLPWDRKGYNMGLIWPYGGSGLLLSADAVRRLREGIPSSQPVGWSDTDLKKPATATMGGWQLQHARSCLTSLTCPWGVDAPCSSIRRFLGPIQSSDVASITSAASVSVRFRQNVAVHSAGAAVGASGLGNQMDLTTAAPGQRRILCRSENESRGQGDCRNCGQTDVQLACCFASAGVYTTDLSALDGRQTPGDAHWSPWAAHLKSYRSNPAGFADQLRYTMRCGLSAGPGAWRRPHGDLTRPRMNEPPCQ